MLTHVRISAEDLGIGFSFHQRHDVNLLRFTDLKSSWTAKLVMTWSLKRSKSLLLLTLV